MTPRDEREAERSLRLGIPLADVLEAWNDRLEILQVAAKAGKGSDLLVIEAPVSRGKQLTPRFVDRSDVGSPRSRS